MKDSEFKQLGHVTGSLRVGSRGTEVAPGYKPDVTIVDGHGKLQFILECEQKTDRKAFIGDFIKEEKYSDEENFHPALIIVMQEQVNTTVKQISQHMEPYVSWLARRRGGALNVQRILIMSDLEYIESVSHGEEIGSLQFLRRGTMISSNTGLQPTAADEIMSRRG